MSQIVWQVRRKGHYYSQTVGDGTNKRHYEPFEVYVGDNLPADFQGEVIRRTEYDYDKFNTTGYIDSMDVDAAAEMYSGPR